MEIMDEMSNLFWKTYEEDLEWRRSELSVEKPSEPDPKILPQPTVPKSTLSPAETGPIKTSDKLPSPGEAKPKKFRRKSRKSSPHSVPQNANMWDYIESAMENNKKSKS